MDAIGITLACVAVLVVPALLLSRRQRHGFRGLRRRSMQDGGVWFLGGNDSVQNSRITTNTATITIPVQAVIMAWI